MTLYGTSMIRSIFLALSFSLITATSNAAFDVNDCVINGMKGVTSDLAAREVRVACNQKNKEYRSQLIEDLSKEYGQDLGLNTLEQVKDEGTTMVGFQSATFVNTNTTQTVTLIRIGIGESAGPTCFGWGLHTLAYRVTMKPLSKLQLVYPNSAPTSCIRLTTVLGRPLSHWKDISVFSTVKPMDRDPWAVFDQANRP